MTALLNLLPDVPLASMLFALRHSNLSGQVIVYGLALGSVVVWSLMIVKNRELRDAARASRRMVDTYRRERNTPVAVFLRRQKFEPSPLYAVYEACCRELGTALESRGVDPQGVFMGTVGSTPKALDPKSLAAVRSMAERVAADQTVALERHMSMLATATTVAPLLGLLGTVWGVLDAFSGMVLGGAAMLSKVAPGISGALLTTVIGLLVAIPSSVGYNVLIGRIRHLVVDMENFSEEFLSDIERYYAP